MVAILYPEEWRMMLEERVWRLERQRYIANTETESSPPRQPQVGDKVEIVECSQGNPADNLEKERS